MAALSLAVDMTTMVFFIAHRLFKRVYNARNRRCLLPDRTVYADDAGVKSRLVDDGGQGDRGFARLPVADNQFALTAADGDKAVNGQNPGLQRRVYGRALHNRRRCGFYGPVFVAFELFAVQRPADRVYDASKQGGPDTDFRNAAGAARQKPRLDAGLLGEQHRARAVESQIQRKGVSAPVELQNLTETDARQTVDLNHVVLTAFYHAVFVNGRLGFNLRDPVFQGRNLRTSVPDPVVRLGWSWPRASRRRGAACASSPPCSRGRSPGRSLRGA